jgi:hypothetical protein
MRYLLDGLVICPANIEMAPAFTGNRSLQQAFLQGSGLPVGASHPPQISDRRFSRTVFRAYNNAQPIILQLRCYHDSFRLFFVTIQTESRKFSVELANAGILSKADRVELLDGQIVTMAPFEGIIEWSWIGLLRYSPISGTADIVSASGIRSRSPMRRKRKAAPP